MPSLRIQRGADGRYSLADVGKAAGYFAAIGTLIGLIVGGLGFVDDRYAHAADMVTIQQTQEQALILIQQELTDDKRWRIISEAKKEERILTPDEAHEVDKLEKRELRLEKRYEVLEEQLLMK